MPIHCSDYYYTAVPVDSDTEQNTNTAALTETFANTSKDVEHVRIFTYFLAASIFTAQRN